MLAAPGVVALRSVASFASPCVPFKLSDLFMVSSRVALVAVVRTKSWAVGLLVTEALAVTALYTIGAFLVRSPILCYNCDSDGVVWFPADGAYV